MTDEKIETYAESLAGTVELQPRGGMSRAEAIEALSGGGLPLEESARVLARALERGLLIDDDGWLQARCSGEVGGAGEARPEGAAASIERASPAGVEERLADYAKGIAAALRMIGPTPREQVIAMLRGLRLSETDAHAVTSYALDHGLLEMDLDGSRVLRAPRGAGGSAPRSVRSDRRRQERRAPVQAAGPTPSMLLEQVRDVVATTTTSTARLLATLATTRELLERLHRGCPVEELEALRAHELEYRRRGRRSREAQ
jgi:hypothetical protein